MQPGREAASGALCAFKWHRAILRTLADRKIGDNLHYGKSLFQSFQWVRPAGRGFAAVAQQLKASRKKAESFM